MNVHTYDRDWIARHIPHSGRMCLLDAVAACDATAIRCHADSHRAADNPLRAHGRLGAAVGIEYAAQAMAVHGAILMPAAEKPKAGFLASVRGVELLTDRLDTVDAPLIIDAERLSGNESTILYRFEVSAAGRALLRGRAAVIVAPHLPAGAGALA